MRTADKDHIINTVFRTNILPIISECNTACIFCSHRQNPEDVEAFRMPKLELEDFSEIIEFLSPQKKIIIGESATRIVEGEPLLHKDFLRILTLVRKKYMNTPIQVTTNGILLNEKLVDSLGALGGVELNVSVNGINYEKRKQLLNLKHDDRMIDKLQMLKGKLKFTGSFVWVPEIVKEKDVEDIVEALYACDADAVRMFLPGCTNKTNIGIDLRTLFKEAYGLVEKIRSKYEIPVIVEPSFIDDLECRVEGVIKDSPSWNAGIRYGDIITEVNGVSVSTRVEAFEKAYRLSNPRITVLRQMEVLNLKIRKQKNYPPGFVLLYDIYPEIVEEITAIVKRHKAEKVLFVTSELAQSIMEKVFEVKKLNCEYRVISAENGYFGGTIKCAGLLTVQDIMDRVNRYLVNEESPDLIVVPPIMFDFKKRDLLGRSIKEIEETLKIPVDTL